MATAAEQLQLEHERAEGHHVTIEDVPDEDLNPHTSTGPSDLPGKENTPVPAPAPVKLDIQSEELFPSLGDSKKQDLPTWGSNNVPANNTNGSSTGPAPSAPTPSRVPVVQLPRKGAEPERLILQAHELKPRNQLKRPLDAIFKDIYTRKGVVLTHKPNPRGQLFEASGPTAKAHDALKELVREIGSTQTASVPIPQSVRAHVIGRQGATIQALEKQTGARIIVPKDDAQAPQAPSDDLDDEAYINVKIEGNSHSCAQAQAAIEKIVKERSVKVNTSLKNIPAEFYPFLANADLASQSSAQINLPPHAAWSSQCTTQVPSAGQRPNFQPAQDHHIQLEGDRQAVLELRQAIDRHVAELREQLLLEQLEIQRGRHQFIIGHSGVSPDEFFQQTGCAIILPTDDDDDAITVVGPEDRIPAAIQKAEQLAQSMSLNNVDHLKWTKKQAPQNPAVHSKNVTRYLRQRNEIKRLEQQYRAHINTPFSGDGALPWELYLPQGQSFTAASSDIRNIFESHPPSRMSTVDVDSFFYPFLSNVVSRQVRDNHGVHLVVPGSSESGAPVLLVYEGPDSAGSSYEIPRTAPSQAEVQAFAEGLRAAEKHIMNLMREQDELVEITLDVPTKYHSKLQKFIKAEQDKQVRANQPRSRVMVLRTAITLRGPRKATQSLAEKIEQFVEELKEDEKERGFVTEFDFPREYANHLIGKQGSRIEKLREQFDVEIQVGEGKVELKGPKAKAAAARRHIESIARDLADEQTKMLQVDPKHHGELIGEKGKQITRLQNKYNVMIFFPSEKKNGQAEDAGEGGKTRRQQGPDQVIIRGPSKGTSAAYDELNALVKYLQEHSHTATVMVQRKQLPSIIGAGGSAVEKLRQETDCQIDLPERNSTDDPAEIKIKGRKADVLKAKKILEDSKSVFDDTVVKTIDVERKYHSALIGAGGSNLKELVAKAGGPDDVRTRARLIQFPKQDAQGNTITLEGRAAVVDSLIKQIQEIVAFRESQQTATVDVPTDKHRSLIGRGGEAKKRLEDKFSVTIDIPRQGSTDTAIKITGQEEDVEKAKNHIAELTKETPAETVQVPRNLHHAISGDRGQFFRKLRSDLHVNVDHAGQTPPPKSAAAARSNGGALPLITDEADEDTHSWNIVSGVSEEDGEIPWVLKGSPENIEKAKALIAAALDQSKNNVTGYLVLPDPSTYRHVIGQGGSKVNSIRKETSCNIDVPKRDGAGEAIKVVGSKESVEKAKDLILAAVRDGVNNGSKTRE